MATIMQHIAISDGVSPVFQRMNKIISATPQRIYAAVQAADRLQSDLGRRAEDLNERLRSMGSGWFSGARSAFSGLIGQFTLATLVAQALGAAISAIASAPGKLMAISDEYSGIQARIRLITKSQEEAAALNDAIYRSALRAHGGYTDMAAAVAKLGIAAKDAFPNPKQIVPFVEGVQKLFKIGGSGIEEQRVAMLQLTQAMTSGRLQGDEFRSISEAAPLIEQMVADYLGVTRGALKQLSSEGKLTSDVIKNAILKNMDTINAQFEQMPVKWGDIWQDMKSRAERAFVPVNEQMEAIANSPAMATLRENFARGIVVAGRVVAEFINTLRWAAGEVTAFYIAHKTAFDRIALAIGIMAAAWIGYNVAVGIATLATAGFAAVMSVGSFISAAVAMIAELTQQFMAVGVAETIAASAGAQMWAAILLPVTLVIGAIYGVVAAVNYFAGTTISATGIIFGVFGWLFANIWNMIALATNYFIAFANFLGSVFVDPLGAAYNLFVDIWNAIVGYVGEAVNSIIKMIHAIPGVSAVIGGEPIDVKSAFTMERKTIENAAWHIDPIATKNPWEMAEAAYDIGANLHLPDFSLPEMEAGGADGYDMSDIAANTGDTAGNTKAIKDAMEITDEDLKYLRDIAEQEAINKYTTAEVKIEMGGIHNNVSNGMDLDGVAHYLNDSLFSAMQAGAEKVHPV
jgi:tape measure domain-containing protein